MQCSSGAVCRKTLLTLHTRDHDDNSSSFLSRSRRVADHFHIPEKIIHCVYYLCTVVLLVNQFSCE